MITYRKVHKKIIAIVAGDAILLWAALYAAISLRQYTALEKASLLQLHIIPFAIIFFLWILTIASFGLYELRMMKNGRIFLLRLMQAMLANIILTIVVLYLFPFSIEPRRNLFVIACLATAFIFLWRYLFNLLVARVPATRVLFAGINADVLRLVEYLRTHPQMGYKPIGFVFWNQAPMPMPSGLPSFVLDKNTLPGIVRDTRTDMLVIAPELKINKEAVSAFLAAITQGIAFWEFPAFHEMTTGKVPLSLIEEVWFVENLIGTKKRSYDIFKRALDSVLASLLSIPTLILFPCIAIAVKISSPGPVFFRQKRVGKNGAIFEIIKFRSTYRASVPEHLGWNKTDDTGAYTPVGAFLRKSYLDELPQLVNIFKGDMSFVGPRPERPEFVERLKEDTPFYEMRTLVPPGITGWAQINMENDASVQDTPEKMQYDLYYIKNRMLLLDLLIMLRTAFALLQRQGR